MPKETFETFSSIPGYDGPPLGLEVVWAKNEGWIQVATINFAKRDDGDGELPGWYVDLDRRTINKIIRVLRRARDHSDPEGKDE